MIAIWNFWNSILKKKRTFNMETKNNEPTKKPRSLTLDERLVKVLGRLPSSIILGALAGALMENLLKALRYYPFGIEQLDHLWYYFKPNMTIIAQYGAIGGLMIGLLVGLVTRRTENRLARAGLGLLVGPMARLLAEMMVRVVKEGSIEYAFSYVYLLSNQLIIAGAVVGLMISQVPLFIEKAQPAPAAEVKPDKMPA